RCLLAALRANVHIFAKRNLNRGKDVLIVKAEALAVGDVADVRTELAVGPEEIADGSEQVFDVIVLLDQLGNIAGSASSSDITERLSRLGIEANGWHVLR